MNFEQEIKCTHIIGRAWMLNNEEGAAWITRFVPSDAAVPAGDFIEQFAFCPCCGEKLKDHDDDTLKMEDAKWK